MNASDRREEIVRLEAHIDELAARIDSAGFIARRYRDVSR